MSRVNVPLTTGPTRAEGLGRAAPAERREFGHIYRRGSVWWVRYRVGGRQYAESAHSAKSADALRVLARRQAELGLGMFTAPNVKRTTLADLEQLHRDDYIANGRRSLARQDIWWKHLRRVLGNARAVVLTSDRLTRYVKLRLAEGVAPPTIHSELDALRSAFRLAKRAGRVVAVPEFPKLAPAQARQGFFEREDLQAVLRELPEYLRAPMEFAYLTGWRVISEVLTLTWAQVDFAAGVVRLEVGSTKTGAGRTFPFSALPPARLLLERQRAARAASGAIVPLVFHRNGRLIGDYYTAWHSACRRAAVVKRGNLEQVVRPALLSAIPHSFRRTAVRNLVRAGVPEHTAMKLTGHKTRAIFDRYDIVSERDLSEGVAKLAAFHERAGYSRDTTGGQPEQKSRAGAAS